MEVVMAELNCKKCLSNQYVKSGHVRGASTLQVQKLWLSIYPDKTTRCSPCS